MWGSTRHKSPWANPVKFGTFRFPERPTAGRCQLRPAVNAASCRVMTA